MIIHYTFHKIRYLTVHVQPTVFTNASNTSLTVIIIIGY